MSENVFLFFDDKNILYKDSLKRCYALPRYAGSYNSACEKSANPLPCVVFVPEKKQYYMYYNSYVNGKISPLLATSEDGVNFVSHPACRDRAIMEHIGELACVYYDSTADEKSRFKALCVCGDGKSERIIKDPVFESADGIHWEKTSRQWHNHAAEPPAFCFYNPIKQKHTILCRPDAGVRRVCRVFTEDFQSFSDAELVMTPDSCDPPLAEHYGMNVFPYGGIFVGFLWLYEVPNIRSRKYWGGTLNAQLCYSYNGTYFNRSIRESFFEHKEQENSLGMIQPCSMYETPDGDLTVAAGVSNNEHGNFKQGTSIAFYKLKKDRFISLRADDRGELVTIPMLYGGGDILVNAEAEEISCALYTDDSAEKPMNLICHELIALKDFEHASFKPIDKGNGFFSLSWDKAELKKLEKKIIYLEIRLYRGDVFSIRGDLTPMMICDLARYHLYGTVPDITGLG